MNTLATSKGYIPERTLFEMPASHSNSTCLHFQRLVLCLNQRPAWKVPLAAAMDEALHLYLVRQLLGGSSWCLKKS